MDTLDVPEFGTLWRDAATGTWRGTFSLGAEAFGVAIFEDEASEARREEIAAELAAFLTREPESRRFVASELLALVNGARAMRLPRAPSSDAEGVAAKLDLHELAWIDGGVRATYRLDEPECAGEVVELRLLGETRAVRTTFHSGVTEEARRLDGVRRSLFDLAGAGRAPTSAEEGSNEFVEVPVLGALRRTRQGSLISWRAALTSALGEMFEVQVFEGVERLPDEEVRRAGARIAAFLKVEPEARRRVASELLDLARDWWASRDDADESGPLTLEAFVEFMRLESVSLDAFEDDLTVYYDDHGEVFAGHAIQARFDAALNLVDTDIPG